MFRQDTSPRDGNPDRVSVANETYASRTGITVPIPSLTPVVLKHDKMHQWNQKSAF